MKSNGKWHTPGNKKFNSSVPTVVLVDFPKIVISKNSFNCTENEIDETAKKYYINWQTI